MALNKARTLTLGLASDIGESLVSGAVNEGLSTAALLSTSSKSLGSVASIMAKANIGQVSNELLNGEECNS